MRKTILLWLIILGGIPAIANHNTGFELRLVYTGVGNVYRIYLTDYQECGIGNYTPNPIPLALNITGCGFQ